MSETFRNKRHEELCNKFSKKQEEFIMVLGGAKEEDARNFSMESYGETLKKKVPEYSPRDSLNLHLVWSYMQGKIIYNKLSSGKPVYCKVLDNIDSPDKIPKKSAKGDPVYDALINLYPRIEEIHEEQFKPFNYSPDRDNALQRHENSGKYELELESKKTFINEIINYFDNRGSNKGNTFEKDTSINEDRYAFLREFLVDSDLETKIRFEKELISNIPMYAHEGFYFWPKE